MTRVMVPPHSLEAEQGVLGSMMINPDAAVVALNEITGDEFYQPRNRAVFAACEAVFQSGVQVDLVTTMERLIADGKLDTVGGPGYISSLTEVIPARGQVQQYCKIIREKYQARETIRLATSIMGRCYSGERIEFIAEDFGADFFGIVADKVKKARPVSEIVKEVLKDIENTSLHGHVSGLMTGFSSLDRRWNGLQSGELTILAARPGMGKSCLAVNIGCNVASKGKKVLIFNLEMEDKSLVHRMIAAYSRITGDEIRRGYVGDDRMPVIRAAGERISGMNMLIDDTSNISVTELMARAKLQQMKHGLDLVIVDYLQLIRTNGDNRVQEIGNISRNLKIMSKELKIPVIVLSQLNRSLESRTDKRPILSDLRDSGSIEQDADVVAFIYRDDYYNPDPANPLAGKSEIITSKQRNGSTGRETLWFRGELSKFEEMEREQ